MIRNKKNDKTRYARAQYLLQNNNNDNADDLFPFGYNPKKN